MRSSRKKGTVKNSIWTANLIFFFQISQKTPEKNKSYLLREKDTEGQRLAEGTEILRGFDKEVPITDEDSADNRRLTDAIHLTSAHPGHTSAHPGTPPQSSGVPGYYIIGVLPDTHRHKFGPTPRPPCPMPSHKSCRTSTAQARPDVRRVSPSGHPPAQARPDVRRVRPAGHPPPQVRPDVRRVSPSGHPPHKASPPPPPPSMRVRCPASSHVVAVQW